ncbi:MAG: hypothetical protein OXH20_10430 [bacterium]|nr:hypothetical protein [bacterium]
MTRPDNLEDAFAAAEQAAGVALDSTKKLQGLLRQLHKAAREGNVRTLKRLQERLREEAAGTTEAVGDAAGSWPFDDSAVAAYLNDDATGYPAELCRVASEQGLDIHERDGQLICYPSTVRILAGERAVRIDRKKLSTIRPSHLVKLLLKNQDRPPRFRPEPFLKALHDVYFELTRDTPTPPGGLLIPLERIYNLLTSLPGSRRDYTRTDFARDLYQLSITDVTETKSGAKLIFEGSTMLRNAKNVITFVDPNGHEVPFASVRFDNLSDL